MTTRRGFIQGVLVAIGATVLPKVAEAETITVPHRKAPLIDNMGVVSIDNFTRTHVYYPGGCAEYHLDGPERTIRVNGPVPMRLIDSCRDSGIIVLVSPPIIVHDDKPLKITIHGSDWEPNSDGDWFGMCGRKAVWPE